MPLFDLFHRPLIAQHRWQALHLQWSAAIVADLNRRLPRQYLAEAPFSLGPFASADVAEVDLSPRTENGVLNGSPYSDRNGGVAVAAEPITYTPPETGLSFSAEFPEEFIIEIRDLQHARNVLAVIEIVSPGNKDDGEAREIFAGKCLSYLAKGIGLVVIDTVTDRLTNLHNVMMRMAKRGEEFEMPGEPSTYVAAYRPVRRKREDVIDLWHWPLSVGGSLPDVPLPVKGVGCVKLCLEKTYTEACQNCRIP